MGSPDYGNAVTLGDNEVPVFWACGVTTQTEFFKPSLNSL
ncbi:DUF1445 domain-containing protein [Scytonema sp. UIC 10036]|nr:DUF1445 domain-containing protein [Scytonema sp. UIC 10036]